MFLVVGGIHLLSITFFLPFYSAVGMKLTHGALWLYGVRAIDLDLHLWACAACALRRAANTASTHSQLRIAKEHHEAGIHVVLLVTMKERQTGIVGCELHLDLGAGINQDGVFDDPVGFRMAGQAAQFKAVPVQVNGMIIGAAIDECQTIEAGWRSARGSLYPDMTWH